MITANPVLSDLDGWRALLAGNGEVFADMVPGARIGILPRPDAEVLRGTMLVWEASEDGMRAEITPFDGYQGCGVDMLFVPDEDALAALHDNAARDPLAIMRSRVRDGSILFYVMKRGKELRALGYEDFLESLGLAYVGACR